MYHFYMALMVISITIYTGLFCYSLYKTDNKKGAAAVLVLILMVIISPFLVYLF
ncbi:hypothetical protein [Terribacillus sp. 7520-G]|uniref:hypothetical protein n=1 Tax=Terribacillus TaxID=459532 RepID=UPI0013041759|nr:hypothetical protein [Terribacillus sp. 7520-G]